ncbi:hypothetical protein [Aquimarina longa]|uniref:hypothetical protein n=1 Tax=Aquimarina longa TaxID=1080221 RepID=UPI000AA2CFB6|nr:hypothetical protein [Aquimarina longa]
MNTNETNEKLIEMSELSKMIRARDPRTALKWCENYNLPIIPIGKKKMTYRFLVDIEVDRKITQLLKKKYPENWEELYGYYKTEDLNSYLLATSEEENYTEGKITSRSNPKSSFAKAFSKT